jgi:hypothetical protein
VFEEFEQEAIKPAAKRRRRRDWRRLVNKVIFLLG